ncbi:16S rRNA (cytidine(1402)-2'-O)-methyltransferase [Galactobacter valiniphilus]|uniref:Ribosomal RNA small subunit methyltransferase I n=1 Tax=Galactobacter valiniphilus TaxID=2676122 RepID=A0A399JBM9_9MICC|nr:16S rRNA (cytidine(1402)-2'-O)-methyltransferase [Galactobacter valiniphilus]RII42948.1 16S rRNA (cytidine(1402)-2'-O)-methyltransferase [Galactobacter valiniphilus]
MSRQQTSGRIVLAGTPIGNLEDAPPRLRRALEEADIVAAEDTRRLHQLVSALGLTLSGKPVAYHEHNEASRAAELVDHAAEGADVVIVSDAGMPTISDPGFRVVEEAALRGVDVSVIPGPSAALVALAGSGLPTDRFTFEGFLPRKPGERRERLAELRDERRTMVFYEAPHRIDATLEALVEGFGAGRRAVLARELTKLYEEFRRGTLGDLLAGVQEVPPRGEIVLVVAGGEAPAAANPEELVAEVQQVVDSGLRLKEACALVAERSGVSKRELYEAVLAARKG